MFRGRVLSDIHSNHAALQAVLAESDKEGPYDISLNAGDLIGYGPNPNECVEAIRERGFVSVLGNHDRVARRTYSTGSTVHFNLDARDAVYFTREELTDESRTYLEGLGNIPYIDPEGRFELVHGSFAGSENSSHGGRYEDVYVFEDHDAAYAMRRLRFEDDASETVWKHVKLGIVGHTHRPTYATMWAGYPEGGERLEFDSPVPPSDIKVDFGEEPEKPYGGILWQPKALVNFGSVGQPRDGDPRAAWGIFEIDGDNITLHYRRTPYDIAETQRKMREAHLPQKLIDRLAVGR